MRTFFLILAAIFSLSASYATGQAPDLIVVGRDTLPLFSNPLEAWFDRQGEREIPGMRGHIISTAFWRGYQAIWQLEDDRIFLTGIFPPLATPEDTPADLAAMFGERYANGKVFADWIDEELRIPQGNRINYVHMGYESTYERDRFLKVRNGKVRSDRIYENYASQPERMDMVPDDSLLQRIGRPIETKINWNAPGLVLAEEDYADFDEFELIIDRRGNTSISVKNMFDPDFFARELRRIFRGVRWNVPSYRGRRAKFRHGIEFELDYAAQRVALEWPWKPLTDYD